MLNDLPEWRALAAHKKIIEPLHMRDMFAQDPQRFDKFNITCGDMLCDYSKHRITPETIALLTALARARNVEEQRDRMMAGDKINQTENRAVLHTALRAPRDATILADGHNIVPMIHQTLEKMADFAQAIHDGNHKGYSGKPIRHIVNIGIGGSDLGPRMVYKALKPFHKKDVSVRFVSNVDAADINAALQDFPADQTLFLVASKTFTTQETMTNAHTARQWLIGELGNEQAVGAHFAALSTNAQAVKEFGIAPDMMFGFDDWVGGRYSLWSAIGLSIALGCGFDVFRALLDGAHAMDRHFRTAPLEKNMPVMAGLLGVWYRNFWDAESYAILPYAQDLALLPLWLQQLDMESNGKSVTRGGAAVSHATGSVVFGQPGTNGQHAFYQLIHQGTSLIPCDFIGVRDSAWNHDEHHRILNAHMIAQSQALMEGNLSTQTDNNPHRAFAGNKPSTTIIIPRLDAYHLGMILALYEHKIFVQGAIWDINSFDQWGVELGKTLAAQILSGKDTARDSSTAALIRVLLG